MSSMKELRLAGPNERRCIVRQELDYYRNLIIGGVYAFDGASSKLSLREIINKALKYCVSAHPILSATIRSADTESPAFARPSKLNLRNHVEFLDSQALENKGGSNDEQSLIKLALAHTHDQIFESCSEVPPWKVVLLPLATREPEKKERFLVLFAYYHSQGDGKSGLAFHRTLLKGLLLASNGDTQFTTADEHETQDTLPLLPTMEQAGRLSISWSYLLSPLLGAYLPTFVSGPLNLRAATEPESHDQWRGQKTSHDRDNFTTSLELLRIDNETMQKALGACRARGAKFTGLLHQLIVRALSQTLSADIPAGSFVSQSAVDLRAQLQGLTNDDMGLCVTGYYELFPRSDAVAWKDWAVSTSDSPVWAAARATTAGLAAVSSTLHDQPVGLLQYLRSFYPWTRAQVGKPRGSSYELSNLLSFDPGHSEAGDIWQIEHMVFSQPANAVGGCLSFNTVSRAGGDLVLIMDWQTGVLGVDDEQAFAARVCGSIRDSLQELADG